MRVSRVLTSVPASVLQYLAVIGLIVYSAMNGASSMGYNWQWYRIPKYFYRFTDDGFEWGEMAIGLVATVGLSGTAFSLAGAMGLLIALLRGGAPVIGVIDMPATAERWVGAAGSPTTRNGAAIRVRVCENLSEALLSTSNIDFYGADDLPALERLKAATRWTVYGGSCMAYAQLASGRIDVGIDVGFDPYDYLALVPVITGAGGVITDWDGNALTLRSRDRVIAAGDPGIHSKSLAVLAGS